MFSKLTRTLITVAAATCAVAVPAAVWAAPSPGQPPVKVGPRQPFAGLVNAKADKAVIRVFCPGVLRTGHPVAGQTVRVALVPPKVPITPRDGFTGTAATSISAWLTWPPTVAPPSPAFVDTFTSYRTLPIPTRIAVPCGGSGEMLFLPVPGSPTVKAATVTLTFVALP